MKYIVYRLNDLQYATPIEEIQSIERLLPIRPVPDSVNHELGVSDLRDAVISIQDLRIKLGLEPIPFGRETRLLVANGIGYVVDAALDVVDVEDTGWEMAAGRRVWRREDTLVLENHLR